MDEDVGKLTGLLEGITGNIQILNKSLLGNGQPGLISRQSRTEESVENLTEDVHELKDMVSSLTNSVGDLKKIMGGHVQDNECHSAKGLFLKKEVLPWVIVAFLILHELSEALNLVEVLKKLIGI